MGISRFLPRSTDAEACAGSLLIIIANGVSLRRLAECFLSREELRRIIETRTRTSLIRILPRPVAFYDPQACPRKYTGNEVTFNEPAAARRMSRMHRRRTLERTTRARERSNKVRETSRGGELIRLVSLSHCAVCSPRGDAGSEDRRTKARTVGKKRIN